MINGLHAVKGIFLKLPYILLGIATACMLDAYVLEPNRITFQTHDIPIADLPDAFEGYRIAVVGDLHYPRWTRRAFIERAFEVATRFRPDLIVIPGDICDRHRGEPRIAPDLAGFFDTLRAPDGILAVLGNHDLWLDPEGVRRELCE